MKFIQRLAALVAALVPLAASAQVPMGTQLRHFSMNSYRDTPEGKKLDFVVTGSSGANLTSTAVLVNQFVLKTYRNGDPRQVQIIALAPECQFDQPNNIASDAGPLQIFTPTTNVYIQGEGFMFTQSNHFLTLSNKVETRVVKSLLKSSLVAAPATNAEAKGEQILKVFADHGWFNLDSNIVDYAGHVHMIDPQLDMTSDLMSVHLTSNGAVESILARLNVVLTTTNHGVATGEAGLYSVTNGDELLRLTTNAAWRFGDEEAHADEFDYDSARHFLTGIGHVKARWPNPGPKSPDAEANPAAPQAGTNGFRELFSDFATMQFPPTNGPVQSIHAHGNVLILNQSDQTSAMAEVAAYERATDRVDLFSNAVWWNNTMQVSADTLTAELTSKLYHARRNAHFKTRTGAGGASSAIAGNASNQWIFISSDDIEYQTNLANFYDNVHGRLEQDGRLQDTLDCDHLTLCLTNDKLERAIALGHVHGETVPDSAGVVKTLSCERLNAYLSTLTGRVKYIEAFTNAILVEKGAGPDGASNQLSAETVTAQFSPVTNQVERAEADLNVILDQFKEGKTEHATARHGVYTASDGQVRLTGSPLARSDTFVVTDSETMIWEPKDNVIRAFGHYKIIPIKPAAVPNPL